MRLRTRHKVTVTFKAGARAVIHLWLGRTPVFRADRAWIEEDEPTSVVIGCKSGRDLEAVKAIVTASDRHESIRTVSEG